MPDDVVGGLMLTLIDMTVVFGVLFGLALLIKAISAIARKAEGAKGGLPGRGANADRSASEAAGLEAVNACEDAVATPTETAAPEGEEEAARFAAVVASAISAYVEDEMSERRPRPGAPAAGWSVIAPARGYSSAWALAGRLSLVQGRESFGRFKHGKTV